MDTSSGRRRDDQDTGSGRRRDSQSEDTPRRGREDWRENTDTGQWRDLTSAASRISAEGPMYDYAADEQHDLDPAARRSLPMYPDPDPSWTTGSGRHAAVGDNPADRRRPGPGQPPPADEPWDGGRRPGYPNRGRAPWEGSTSDTGQHHRTDPDAEDLGGDEPRAPGHIVAPREVGGRRRRLEAWERRVTGGRT